MAPGRCRWLPARCAKILDWPKASLDWVSCEFSVVAGVHKAGRDIGNSTLALREQVGNGADRTLNGWAVGCHVQAAW